MGSKSFEICGKWEFFSDFADINCESEKIKETEYFIPGTVDCANRDQNL
jgi:hypothetical protein